MDISYNGIWGYAPLLVSLAGTKEALYVINRPGNAPSHAGAATWIDKAIDLVAPHAQRVCLRGDTDFSLTGNFDRWAEQVDFDEIRYFFYVTTRTDLSPAEVVACANERCDQENIIEQLKNGINALRVPLYDLVSNWAYMVIAALAWNIKSWFAMMMHRTTDRRDYIRMEYRRFLHSVILIPAMVFRRARSITIRIISYHPRLEPYSACNTIARTRYG